jgi:hypothetical protein
MQTSTRYRRASPIPASARGPESVTSSFGALLPEQTAGACTDARTGSSPRTALYLSSLQPLFARLAAHFAFSQLVQPDFHPKAEGFVSHWPIAIGPVQSTHEN